MVGIIDKAIEEFAAEVGPVGPIAIQGGKTRWDMHGVLDPEAKLLSAPAGIVTYKPEEMIVTARAGTTVAELKPALAPCLIPFGDHPHNIVKIAIVPQTGFGCRGSGGL